MRRVSFGIILLSLCVSAASAAAPNLSAMDFLPVVQAPAEQQAELLTVKDPEAVKQETDPISKRPGLQAATMQDAINTFVAQHAVGCMMVSAPGGGYGFVATGMGVYDKDLSNLTAQRVSQRLAYLQALINAKVEMSKEVSATDVEGSDILSRLSVGTATGSEDSSSSGTVFHSSGKSATSAVLQGYVTYSVYDDFENGIVYVTIVSTPKTILQYNRPANDTLMAANLAEGMNAILSEIQSGIVPPVGGRIVDVPETGEVAFVGFGSAVVPNAKSAAQRATHMMDAQKIATIRAESELCGIITGDTVDGQASYRESVKQAFGDYSAIEKLDPIHDMANQNDAARADAIKESFRSNTNFNETITSARRGSLPPGVTRRAWLDEDNAFAYAVAVYVPSFSDAAAAGGQAMQNAEILKPVEPSKGRAPMPEQDEAAGSSPAPNGLKRGVTGVVKQNL